jgi:hypothetical protein
MRQKENMPMSHLATQGDKVESNMFRRTDVLRFILLCLISVITVYISNKRGIRSVPRPKRLDDHAN